MNCNWHNYRYFFYHLIYTKTFLRTHTHSHTYTWARNNAHIFLCAQKLLWITFSSRHNFLKLNCGNELAFGSNSFNSKRTVLSSCVRALDARFFELPEDIVSKVTRFGSDIVNQNRTITFYVILKFVVFVIWGLVMPFSSLFLFLYWMFTTLFLFLRGISLV